MKKLSAVLLCIILTVFASQPSFALTSEPSRLEGDHYMVINMDTGDVLLEHGADDVIYPASTTKMLTGILIIENMDLAANPVLTADEEVASTTGTCLKDKLKSGEEIHLVDALNAMLVGSCNDCAALLAKAMSGSIEAFAQRMNQKLLEIGASNTHFVNPHGLHDENHYTTARDLSIIAQYCMQNETFRKIVAQGDYTVPKTNKCNFDRFVTSTNLLVWDKSTMIYVYNDRIPTYYEGTIGIKTGNTNAAGACLICAAQRDGTTVMSIMMHSTSYGRYADTHKLLNWGFENYRTVRAVAGGTLSDSDVKVKHGEFNHVSIAVEKDMLVNLPVDVSDGALSYKFFPVESVKAPVEKGQILGTVEVYREGSKVGECNAVAASDIAVGEFLSIFGIEDAAAHRFFVSLGLILLLAVLSLTAWVLIMRHRIKVKRAKKAARLAAKKAEQERLANTWYVDIDSKAGGSARSDRAENDSHKRGE